MKSNQIAALTALLSAGAQAVPMAGHHHQAPAHAHMHLHNKRDLVWVTVFDIETVTVMETVYDDGSGRAPTQAAPKQIKKPEPTSYPAPAPSSPAETGGAAPVAHPYTPPQNTQAPAPSSSSTTSVYVAPPAPTTQAPAPTSYPPQPAPATTYAPALVPQQPSQPPTQPSQPSSGGGAGGINTSSGATYTGDMTYFDAAGGSCGYHNSDGDDVIAISHLQMDSQMTANPNNNPLCGRMVNILTSTGVTIPAKVVDRCTGCSLADIDATRSLFNKIDPTADGRKSGIQWSWA